MAEALETIDGIARRLRRDVYYLALVDGAGGFRDIYTDVFEIRDWLDARQIDWSLCAGFDENTVWIEGGPGCIFLDMVLSQILLEFECGHRPEIIMLRAQQTAEMQ